MLIRHRVPALLTAGVRTARRHGRAHAAAVLALTLALLLPLAQVGGLSHALLHLSAAGNSSHAAADRDTAEDEHAASLPHGSRTCALCPVFAQVGAALGCCVAPIAQTVAAGNPPAALAATRASAFTTAYWPRGPPRRT